MIWFIYMYSLSKSKLSFCFTANYILYITVFVTKIILNLDFWSLKSFLHGAKERPDTLNVNSSKSSKKIPPSSIPGLQ